MTTRRTVLKSIAAAIMAPTVQLRQAVPDERLLMAFCEDESYRYHIDKPFGVGSLTYATDCRAMIRCELAGRIEDGERHLPNVAGAWKKYWQPAARWRPLTPDDLVPTENLCGLCPECGDRRVSFGDEYPTNQTEADALPSWCPDDNSIRDVSCPSCHGQEYGGPSSVRICGVRHSSWNLRRILALPNPQVCSSGFLDAGKPESRCESILFRADGFQGISMGQCGG